MMRRANALLVALPLLLAPTLGAAQWSGFEDRSAGRAIERYGFDGAAGSNENYYDGDFGDYDGDFRVDRALISRYGLLRNGTGAVFVPMSTQRDATRAPNSAMMKMGSSTERAKGKASGTHQIKSTGHHARHPSPATA